MNEADVNFSDADEPPIWIHRYKRFCQAVMDVLGFRDMEVSVLLCRDQLMRQLNYTYRNIDNPTDVLSFEQDLADLPDFRPCLAGDIVISLETVFHQAAEFGVTYEEELKRVTIHGLLHLHGQDHATSEPMEPMLIQQENIMVRFSGERIFR